MTLPKKRTSNRGHIALFLFAGFLAAPWILSGCTFDPTASTSNRPDSSILCGNGVVDLGEDCDGQQLNGQSCSDLGYPGGQLGCSNTCRFDVSQCAGAAQCGNGVIESGEECDGNQLGGQTCQDLHFSGGTLRCSTDCRFDTSGCEIPVLCGNGTLDTAEECDDGNNEPGDGCSAACRKEDGWNCDDASPTSCEPICGDGILIQNREECDDGNENNGDGCSSTCRVEDYYSCGGVPSVCVCRVLVDQDSQAVTPDGKTWDSSFSDLRDGIRTVVGLTPDCSVWVAQGTYESYIDDQGDSFELENRLKLYGGFCGTENLLAERDMAHCETILAAGGSTTVLSAVGIADARIDGFTIAGGTGGPCGGGLAVENASIAVHHCTFQENQADSGGAVCVSGNSHVVFFADTFSNNQSIDGNGGAIQIGHQAAVEMRTCDFQDNEALQSDSGADGGAISVEGNAVLQVWTSRFDQNHAQDNGGAINATGQSLELHDVSFDANQADSDQDGDGSGGAVRNGYGSSTTLENCSFSGNRAVVGGAFMLLGGTATITDTTFEQNQATYAAGALGAFGDWSNRGSIAVSRCLFRDNQADTYSGAVRISAWDDSYPADADFDNCLFSGNALTSGSLGGAISVVFGATLVLTNATVTRNSTTGDNSVGGLMAYRAEATIRNSILWHNDGDDVYEGSDSTVTVTYSLVGDTNVSWSNSAGNISTDPRFVDAANDFHLQDGSHCIDAAQNFNDPLDLEKNSRNVDQTSVTNTGPNGDFVDMGAYERQ